MPNKERLDYKIACLSNDGPPKDHPYLDKVQKECAIEPVKISDPVIEKKVDKGFRRILLAGFGEDLKGSLEKIYSTYNSIQRLEYVFAETTDQAKEYIRSEKFDYIFTPALKGDSTKKFVVKGKQGRKTEEVPVIGINGYDIAFAASQKGIHVFIYQNSIDTCRAKLVGARSAESINELEDLINEHETTGKNAFMVSIKEKCESLKIFLKKKRQGIGRIEAESIHIFV